VTVRQKETEVRGNDTNLSEAKRLEIRGVEQAEWRSAGGDFEKLANLRVATDHYPTDLWNAATAYMNGHDFANTARVLDTYLRKIAETNRPNALVVRGEARLALGELDAALLSVSECIDSYPHHPTSYKARILAAQIYLEKHETRDNADDTNYRKLAKARLEANHSDPSLGLKPEAPEWQESAFMLGSIWFDEGIELEVQSRMSGVDDPDPTLRAPGLAVLADAKAAFEEAAGRNVRKDPSAALDTGEVPEGKDNWIGYLYQAKDNLSNERQKLLATFMLAEAKRFSARYFRQKIPTEDVASMRDIAHSEKNILLSDAVELYTEVISHIRNRSNTRTEVEQALLRNCYFGRADAHFDMGDWKEARTAYKDVGMYYQQQGNPVALEAYLQEARCNRLLSEESGGGARVAKQAITRAKTALATIRPEYENDFLKTTRYDRGEWENLLNWLEQRYNEMIPAEAQGA